MKKITTSMILYSLLVILLIVGAVAGGVYLAKSKNLVLVPKTNTVSSSTVDTTAENKTASVDPLEERVDVDEEITEMDKSINSTKSDDFSEEELTDTEVGI